MIIHMLKASLGDCFLVDFENGKCILIDGGTPSTFDNSLKDLLFTLNREGKTIEYLICTHYDNDHIGGLIKFVQYNGHYSHPNIIPVENVIYNSFELHLHHSEISRLHMNNKSTISYKQMVDFDKICLCYGYPLPKAPIISGNQFEGTGYSFRIIAPYYEALEKSMSIELTRDHTKTINQVSAVVYTDIQQWLKADIGPELSQSNCASIAFELIVNEQSFLFCGDADMNSYKSLLNDHYNFIKLSHHGTLHGNECFVGENPITAPKYFLSTNSSHYNHPEIRLLGEIVLQTREKELLLNYDIPKLNGRDYYLLNSLAQQVKYNFKVTVSNKIII